MIELKDWLVAQQSLKNEVAKNELSLIINQQVLNFINEQIKVLESSITEVTEKHDTLEKTKRKK